MGVCVICALFLGARGHDGECEKNKEGRVHSTSGKKKRNGDLTALNRCGRIDVWVQLNESLMVSSVSDMCTVHDILFFGLLVAIGERGNCASSRSYG